MLYLLPLWGAAYVFAFTLGVAHRRSGSESVAEWWLLVALPGVVFVALVLYYGSLLGPVLRFEFTYGNGTARGVAYPDTQRGDSPTWLTALFPEAFIDIGLLAGVPVFYWLGYHLTDVFSGIRFSVGLPSRTGKRRAGKKARVVLTRDLKIKILPDD